MNRQEAALDPRTRIRRRRQRGAALILTVIVVMVLTTLAFAMVTFTTTEERTATTFRDSLQTRAMAEAGVRLVQQMFLNYSNRAYVPLYSPTAMAAGTGWDYWGANESAIETNLNAMGVWRSARIFATPQRYTGGNGNFFQPPFHSTWANIFGGTYNSVAASDIYDLKFNCFNPQNSAVRIADANCWLQTNFNVPLFQADTDWNLDTGRITDISFYGPPSDSTTGKAYGIATVRVTAEKRTSWGTPLGTLLARETIVAVIGDATPKPAIFGDGDVRIGTTGSRHICGDGCQQIHANGNVDVAGDIAGGEDPMVTAVAPGDVGGTTSGDVLENPLTPPEINPWDLAYRPTNSAELDKYYLVTARRLDAVWRDGNGANNPAPRPCGNNQLSWCQDYSLEYEAPPSTTPKTARTGANDASNDATTRADDPHMYKWNQLANEWTECTTTVTLSLSCGLGEPQFAVTRVADGAGGADDADIPFNGGRVARTQFEIQAIQNGATVLVDGKFYKQGGLTASMSIIAAGSVHLHSNTEWNPALSNKVMWLAGRDVYFHADCCLPSSGYPCPVSAGLAAKSGIVGAHEQIEGQGNAHLGGIVMGENHVNYDPTVNRAEAIWLDQGDHGYMCGEPNWPWTLPTTPVVLSMTTAGD